MAYIDARQGWNRPGPIAAVVAIHAGIGFLLVTGLTATVIEHIEKNLPTIDFPTTPPEAETPPPPSQADPVDQP